MCTDPDLLLQPAAEEHGTGLTCGGEREDPRGVGVSKLRAVAGAGAGRQDSGGTGCELQGWRQSDAVSGRAGGQCARGEWQTLVGGEVGLPVGGMRTEVGHEVRLDVPKRVEGAERQVEKDAACDYKPAHALVVGGGGGAAPHRHFGHAAPDAARAGGGHHGRKGAGGVYLEVPEAEAAAAPAGRRQGAAALAELRTDLPRPPGDTMDHHRGRLIDTPDHQQHSQDLLLFGRVRVQITASLYIHEYEYMY